jgi:hypothetical protein
MKENADIPVLVHTPDINSFQAVGLAHGTHSWKGSSGEGEHILVAVKNLASTGAALGGQAVVNVRIQVVADGDGSFTAIAYGDAISWN